MTHHTVVLSGGLDSTNALALAAARMHEGDTLSAVSFYYGQRHERELDAGARIAEHFGIAREVIRIDGLMHGSALLHADAVPEGHYAKDTMSATVVQGRNLMFAAAAVAASPPHSVLWFGVHSGDHFIYPDCRPEFWTRLGALVSDAYDVTVRTPFVHTSKAGALTVGLRHDAPVALSYSCYVGGERHCGRCGTCVERAEAFALAGADDPTDYVDADYWRTAIAEHEAARA